MGNPTRPVQMLILDTPVTSAFSTQATKLLNKTGTTIPIVANSYTLVPGDLVGLRPSTRHINNVFIPEDSTVQFACYDYDNQFRLTGEITKANITSIWRKAFAAPVAQVTTISNIPIPVVGMIFTFNALIKSKGLKQIVNLNMPESFSVVASGVTVASLVIQFAALINSRPSFPDSRGTNFTATAVGNTLELRLRTPYPGSFSTYFVDSFVGAVANITTLPVWGSGWYDQVYDMENLLYKPNVRLRNRVTLPTPGLRYYTSAAIANPVTLATGYDLIIIEHSEPRSKQSENEMIVQPCKTILAVPEDDSLTLKPMIEAITGRIMYDGEGGFGGVPYEAITAATV